MSDHRDRRGVSLLMWGTGLVFLALVVVNLGMTMFKSRLPSVLSEERLQALAFWGGWSLAAAACAAGWWWAGKAIERSDRESTRRLRACFVVALCGVVLLAVAAFERSFERQHLAAIAAALMALVVAPFALSARALTAGAGRRRRRRSREEG